jgi:hypothetical protein
MEDLTGVARARVTLPLCAALMSWVGDTLRCAGSGERHVGWPWSDEREREKERGKGRARAGVRMRERVRDGSGLQLEVLESACVMALDCSWRC